MQGLQFLNGWSLRQQISRSIAFRLSSGSGRLAQPVRAPALQAGGPQFDPVTAHHNSPRIEARYPGYSASDK